MFSVINPDVSIKNLPSEVEDSVFNQGISSLFITLHLSKLFKETSLAPKPANKLIKSNSMFKIVYDASYNIPDPNLGMKLSNDCLRFESRFESGNLQQAIQT
jgi:hypothetical protein